MEAPWLSTPFAPMASAMLRKRLVIGTPAVFTWNATVDAYSAVTSYQIQVFTNAGLTQLDERAFDLLILPYGSAFPAEASSRTSGRRRTASSRS